MDLPINVTPLGSEWGWIINAFKSFFHQVSTWDLSLLKWAFLLVIAIFVLYFIYMVMSGKIRFNNLIFWQDYWVKFVVWNFGSWKTKNLFQHWFLRKKENPDWILIANIPYNFVDFFFDSKEDFDCLMKDLVQYIRDTNSVELLKEWKQFPPILILWDEIHEYLFSRDFKSFSKDVVLVLTQCRKRNIEISCISQRLAQVDVFLKRLVGIFHQFKLIWPAKLWLRREYIKECIDPESNNIDDELAYEELDSCILLPDKMSLFFHKDLQDYYNQKYLTYYVVWWCNVYANDDDIQKLNKKQLVYSHKYEELKDHIMKKFELINQPVESKESEFSKFIYKLTHRDEVNEDIIKKQKDMIQNLIKMIPEEELSKNDLIDFSLINNNDNNVIKGVENPEIIEENVENSSKLTE